MHVDGLWYATISKNLAEGFGSFWAPAFTATMAPVFNAHPPLAHWWSGVSANLGYNSFLHGDQGTATAVADPANAFDYTLLTHNKPFSSSKLFFKSSLIVVFSAAFVFDAHTP